MIIDYPKFIDGKYRKCYVNDVPLDYLIWIFPLLKRKPYDFLLYISILDIFLKHSIRIEEFDNKYYFYFNDYKMLKPPGVPREFLISNWRSRNSKGNYVYEIINNNDSIFIIDDNIKQEISFDYVSHKYLYGGNSMVYEKNPNYYFKDITNKVMSGAYLLRKPYIPDSELIKNFSKNIKY